MDIDIWAHKKFLAIRESYDGLLKYVLHVVNSKVDTLFSEATSGFLFFL